MLSTYENIIFDLDGVIFDTDQGRFNLLYDILLELNLDHSKIDKNRMVGLSTKNYLNISFPELDYEIINQIYLKRKSYYINNLRKYCQEIDGVRKVIKQEYAKNKKLFIATTNDFGTTKAILDEFNLAQYFIKLYTREQLEQEKSLLKNYPYLIKTENLIPHKSVILEDSLVGIQSAIIANIDCIQIKCTHIDVFIEGPKFVINNYSELLDTNV